MKNIIIGTAGHVDHGTTRLIKALSGIDTDRLEEEKKRGITIELGFAHIPNDAGYNIGVIDVPGHEKFIKNMLAGIGGIDFVLFVVAADEGIMPQTREHFEILQALGIDDGIIAITKTSNFKASLLFCPLHFSFHEVPSTNLRHSLLICLIRRIRNFPLTLTSSETEF